MVHLKRIEDEQVLTLFQFLKIDPETNKPATPNSTPPTFPDFPTTTTTSTPTSSTPTPSSSSTSTPSPPSSAINATEASNHSTTASSRSENGVTKNQQQTRYTSPQSPLLLLPPSLLFFLGVEYVNILPSRTRSLIEPLYLRSIWFE